MSALSLRGLVSGHWSAWQAARVEVYRQQEDSAGEVVQRVQEPSLARGISRGAALALGDLGYPSYDLPPIPGGSRATDIYRIPPIAGRGVDA